MVVGLAAGLIGASFARTSARAVGELESEKADARIAAGLASNALFGSRPTEHPARFRLPMYLGSILGGKGENGAARGLSLTAGVVTVMAAAGLANSLFGIGSAVVTALILAASPYFLAHERLAMSEGDVYLACFATLAMWAFTAFLRSPSNVRWVTAGVLLALAVGAHVFAIFLVPVFWLLSALSYAEPPFTLSRMPDHARRVHRLLAWQVGIILATFGLALFQRYPPTAAQLGWLLGHFQTASIIGWIMLILLWIGTAIYVLVMGVLSRSRAERFWGMMAFSFCAFFALMPVHLLDPSILKETAIRAITWDGRIPFARAGEAMQLYGGIVLLKATIPVGLAVFAALVFGAFAGSPDGRWRPCVFAVLVYFAALVAMPVVRASYLMAIYPLFVVLAAAGIAGVTGRLRELRSGPLMTGWILVVLGAMVWLGVEARRASPEFDEYGQALLSSQLRIFRGAGADSTR